MVNFLGPFYDKTNVNTYEQLYGSALLTKYGFENFNSTASLRDNSVRQQISVPFTNSLDTQIKHIDLFLKMLGTVSTGTITVSLYSDNGSGLPGSLLGSSAALQANTISPSQWDRTRFTFSTPISVSAGFTYHIVLTGTFTISPTNYIQIAIDSSPTTNHRSTTYNGSAWSIQTYLGIYEVYNRAQSRIAQSFYATGSNQIDQVVLYIKRTGIPTGNLFVEIVEDSNGVPGNEGPANNISNAFPASGLADTQADIVFSFTTRPQLVDGRKYWIVLSCTGLLSDSNNVDVGIDSISPAYINNNFSRSNQDGTWYLFNNVDMAFAVYYETAALPSTLSDELAALGDPPSDFRQLAGWVKELRDTLATAFPNILPAQYGGTGAGSYNRGDMLYAASTTHLERLSPGPEGSYLGIVGGIPTWGGGGGQMIQSYYNSSGLQIDPYDTVVFDSLVEKGIKLSSMGNDPLFAGIAQDIIPPGEWGPVLTHGISKARLSGTCSNQDGLFTATTTRRVMKQTYGNLDTPIVALQSGTDGMLIDVYVNAYRTKPRSVGQWVLPADYNVNNYAANVWAEHTPSRMALHIYSGIIRAYVQFNLTTTQTVNRHVRFGVYMDGVLLTPAGFARTAPFSTSLNNGEATVTGELLYFGITPGLHTFGLGLFNNGGGPMNLKAGFGDTAFGWGVRSMFSIEEK